MSERNMPDGELMLSPEKMIPLIQSKKSLEKLDLGSTNLSTTDSEIISSKLGVFHQYLMTGAILMLAAGCGMPMAYSAVILPQLYKSNDTLRIDMEMGSWIASIHSAATPIGSFVSGPLMDYYGRRPAIMIAIFPLLIGWSILGTATSHFAILAGRIVAGIATGLIGAPAQIILAEIAQPSLRGLLVGAPFVAYSSGILIIYGLGSELHWRYVAWLATILPMISFAAMFFAPESPTWLARQGQLDRASKSLSWLRGGDMYAKKELQILIARIESEKEQQRNHPKGIEGVLQTLRQASVIKPLVIINGFHILQILSGTFLVVFFATDLISEIGGDSINSMTAIILTAVVRLVFTVFYCFLLLQMKRRTMVITSGLGSGISALVLGIFMFLRLGLPKTQIDMYISAVCLLIYIGSNTAFLCMPGIMVGELLPARVRGLYAGFIFSAFNIVLFCVANRFLIVSNFLKTHGVFMVFGLSSFAASAMLYFLLPETKGRTLDQIEDHFTDNSWIWSKRNKTDKKNFA